VELSPPHDGLVSLHEILPPDDRKIAPALATGCAIIFKPAEQTPLSTLRFAELFEKAGYPSGVFNLVNGLGRVTGEALCRHKDIDKVSRYEVGVGFPVQYSLVAGCVHWVHGDRSSSRYRCCGV
jgi:hypothetical protein